MSLLILYFQFFKIGLFAVGGGLATLPFLFELADKSTWLDREMIANFLAIAQSSPGPIGVNMAALTGFQYCGIPGGIIAALGLTSPAIIVISIVARVMKSFRENIIVGYVFSGLRPAAAGLLAAACFGILKLSLYNSGFSKWYEVILIKELLIFAILFFLIYKFKKHPVIYIAIGAAVGIILNL